MKIFILSVSTLVLSTVIGSQTIAQTPTGTENFKLLASDGTNYDVFGYDVSVSGEIAIVGAFGDDDLGNFAGSAYIYRFDGTNWLEEAKLLASDGASSDYFGYSVSISGNTAIVGAYGDSNTGTDYGAAYIFRFNGSAWIEEAKLLASDGWWDDAFGYSVSISGDTVVVGASRDDDNGVDSGSSYIFRFDGTQWVEEAKFIVGGSDVCISGDRVSIGGAATYIFHFDGSAWFEEAMIYPGGLTCIAGGVAIIGTSIYRFDGSQWMEEAQIVGGSSKSISGDIAIVGVDHADEGAVNSGAVYMFRFDGSEWLEEIKFIASDSSNNDWLGISVSVSGETVFAGANGVDDNGSNAGAVYVFDATLDADGDGVPDNIDNCRLPNPDQIDCNENGIGDVCDVVDGTSFDCDWNGVPDECQPDCNNNGIADACDIAAGIEFDCDQNGIPDSCDVASVFQEKTKLIASDWVSGDTFGKRVSVTGNSAAVAQYSNGIGSICMYRFDGFEWVEEATLVANDGTSFTGSQEYLSTSDDLVIVSGGGAAFVFRFNGYEWHEEAKLVASDGAIDNGYGKCVAIDNNYAVIGAPYDDDQGQDSGAAYVYHYNGSNWVEVNKLYSPIAGTFDYFGLSIAVSGNTVMVGAPAAFGINGAGEVHVFSIEYGCVEYARITPSEGQMNDMFGRSISISGDVAIIGVWNSNDFGYGSGSAYIFRLVGCTWVEEAKLLASDGEAGDRFGGSVSISGNTAIVGIYRFNSSAPGSAYIFRFIGNGWFEESKLLASDGTDGDAYGYYVSISGDTAIISASDAEVQGEETGSAYILQATDPAESGDCNQNGVPDICELDDPLNDQNNNGILDECECTGDVDADGFVNVMDLLAVISYWGTTNSEVDVNADGIVNVADLLIIINNWGACE